MEPTLRGDTPEAARAVSATASARVDAILEGAAAAFSAQGFAATSMRDVARRSGASVGSIYYHFENKEDILRALIRDNFRRVLTSLRKRLEGVVAPQEQLDVFVDNHIRFFARHLAEMRVMSHELDTLTGPGGEEVAAIRHEYTQAALEILGRLRPDLEPDELRIHGLCLFGMLNWTYRWYHTVPTDIGAGGLARRMTGLFLDGFRRSE